LRAFSAAFFSAPAHITGFRGISAAHHRDEDEGNTKGQQENSCERILLHNWRLRCYAALTSILCCTMRRYQEKKGKVPGRRPTGGHIQTSEAILQV